MANTDIKYRDFEGVTFNGRHSSEFHLVRVSDGDRYQISLIPSSQHQTIDMPGKDGSYYYGKKDETKNFSLKFAFDELTELDIRKIRQWLNVDEPVSLIFDEWPYKVYYVMPEGEPVMETICFNRQDGSRVYKGEVEMNMIAYYPYARSQSKRLIDYDTTRVADSREFEEEDNIVEGWYEDFDKYITRIDTEVFTRVEGLPYPELEEKYKYLLPLTEYGGNEVLFYLLVNNIDNYNEETEVYQQLENSQNRCYVKVGDGHWDTFSDGGKYLALTTGGSVYNLSVETEDYPPRKVLISYDVKKQQGYDILSTSRGQYIEKELINFDALYDQDSAQGGANISYYDIYAQGVFEKPVPIESTMIKLYQNNIHGKNFLGIHYEIPKYGRIVTPSGDVPAELDIIYLRIYQGGVNSPYYEVIIDVNQSILVMNQYDSLGFLIRQDFVSNEQYINENSSLLFYSNNGGQGDIEILNFLLPRISLIDGYFCYSFNKQNKIEWNTNTKRYEETLNHSHTDYTEGYHKILTNFNFETFSFTDEALSRLETPPSLKPSIIQINEWNLFNKHPELGNEFSIKREDGEYQNYYDFLNSANGGIIPCFNYNSIAFDYKFIQNDDNVSKYGITNGNAWIQLIIEDSVWNLLKTYQTPSGSPTLTSDILIIPFLQAENFPRLAYGAYTSKRGFLVSTSSPILRIGLEKEYKEEEVEQIFKFIQKNGFIFYYYPTDKISFLINPDSINYYNDWYGVKFPLWRKNNYISSEAPFSKIYINARSKAKWENAREWLEASGILGEIDGNSTTGEYSTDKYDEFIEEEKKMTLYNPGDVPAPYKLAFNFNLAGRQTKEQTIEDGKITEGNKVIDLISLSNDYSLYWDLGGLDQTSIKLTADTRAALLNRVNFIDFNSLSPNYYLVDEYNRIQNLKYDGRWYSQMPLQKITFEKDTDLTLVLALSDDLVKETNLWTHAKINFYRISDNINYNFPAKSFQITPREVMSANNRQFSISHTVPKGSYLISIQCFFKKSEGAPAGWGSNPENNYTWREQEIGKYYQLYLFENNKEPNENYITGQICFDSDKQSIYWTSDTRREVLLEDMLEEGKYLPIPVTNFFLDEQLDKTIDINFHFWKKNGTARTEIDDIGEIGLNTNSPIEIEYDYLYY